MIPVVAALFAVLPGYALSGMRMLSRNRSAGAAICEAIVWSALIDSAPAWLPYGDRIPLAVWIFVVSAAACAGGVVAGLQLYRYFGRRSRNDFPTAFFWLAFVPLCCFGFILIVRPIVDWDAITYYLPVAIDTVLLGHTSIYLSSHITTAWHAPNVQPPVMPMLYALAIGLAAMTHSGADAAVRLIALVFVSGTWLTTRRIARLFVSPMLADGAGLLYLLLPITISSVCSNPLYLDFGFTFLSAVLLAEILEFRAGDAFAWLRIGAIASAAVLMKIDGLPFIVLVICALAVTRLPKSWGRIAALLIAAAMIAVSAKLHFFAGLGSSDLWASIAIVTALLLYCSRPCVNGPKATIVSATLTVVALLPAILQMVRLTLIVGSPAAYYVPQLARVPTPHWHQAVRLINSASVYASATPPGLPQHFGPGLLLWWGFSPLLAIFALAGIFAAARRGTPLLQVVVVVLLFALAFLTVFRLDDFRHLMPITPLLCVLAAYAVAPFAAERQRAWIATLLLAAVPFTWSAQQRFFSPPLVFLHWLHIDQWQEMSTPALVNVLLICGTMLLVGAFVVPAVLRRIPLVAFIIAAIVAIFAPVIAAAAPPGMVAHGNSVLAAEANGYPSVALPAIDIWHSHLLLTYKSYGITWFSQGHARRLDLIDATDLARIQPTLDLADARTILKRLHVDGSILPTNPGPEMPAFSRLVDLGRLYGVHTLNDPLLSASDVSPVWTYRRFYPLTEPGSLQASLYLTGAQHSVRLSAGAFSSGGIWESLRVESPGGIAFTHAVANTTTYGDGSALNAEFSVPVHHGSVDLGAIARTSNRSSGAVHLRAITFSNTRGKVVASFRSLGLVLTPAGGGYRIKALSPFMLHAASAVTPAVVTSTSEGAAFPLHYGSYCARRSPILLRAGNIRVRARAGSEVQLRFAGREKPKRLLVEGQGTCRISETLALRGRTFVLQAVTLRR